MISNDFITRYINIAASEEGKTEIASANISAFADSIINSSNMAVIAIDMDKKIVMVNTLAAALIEHPETDLLGEYIYDILPFSPLKNLTSSNLRSLPREFKIGTRTIKADRSEIKLNDKILGAISFFRDVSQNESCTELSNQIQRKEFFLNEIIENSYDGIYITDCTGKTILVNKAYERISGISRSQLIGAYMPDLVAAGIISTSITKDVVEKKETVTRTQRNLNNKEVIITGSPIFDSLGNVQHVITNVRDITELITLNNQLQAESRRADIYQQQILAESSDENIVYGSLEFETVLNISRKISRMDSTVLILGETGVGKEIIAQYIHKSSNRSNKPYIKINCGAIPQNLLESELFGYVPGAFTGASTKGKPGLFELADTGTLFLDEIGELPINLQASLLRALQDGEVIRVGGTKSKKVDVRIIAATNRDLEKMINEGLFRSDLYYRLNVISINIPPLRERKADIPYLAEKTISDLNKKYHADKVLSPNFIQLLMRKDWPGNIRELKNYIEKQFVLSDESIIDKPLQQSYDSNLHQSDSHIYSSNSSSDLPTYAEAKKAMEKDLFTRALKKGKSTYKAAEILGMSQSTFFRRYKELFPDGLKQIKNADHI